MEGITTHLVYHAGRKAFVPIWWAKHSYLGSIPPQDGAGQPPQPGLLTGSSLDGFRNKIPAGLNNDKGYTHLLLIDPNYTIQDLYTASGGAISQNGNCVEIPAGSGNYWLPIFQFVTYIQPLGRRKVLVLDRNAWNGMDWTRQL